MNIIDLVLPPFDFSEACSQTNGFDTSEQSVAQRVESLWLYVMQNTCSPAGLILSLHPSPSLSSLNLRGMDEPDMCSIHDLCAVVLSL